MDNLQATTLALPQTANAAAAAPADTQAADPAAGDALTGFQTLLAQQLKGLLPTAAADGALAECAADEKAGDAEEADGAALVATDMPWLALIQQLPAAPLPAGGIATVTGTATPAGDAALPALDAGAARTALSAQPDPAARALDNAGQNLRAESLAFADHMAGSELFADSREASMAANPQLGFLHNAQAAPAAPAAQAVAQMHLPTPIENPAWGNELGQKLVWMVVDKQHVAEMHINPPQLGPVDIKLTVDGSDTTAVFTSPHSEVRQALESALPRLREVLAESGIMLGNASVTSDTPRDGSAFAQHAQRGPRPGGAPTGPAETDAQPVAPAPVHARGMVDLFA